MDVYRESAVYVQPDIEGYLDKKESGVLRTKIIKGIWCWVQGSIFYQQKAATNNSGPGGIDVIDMTDAHYVRKLSTDTTGMQFEIFIKKGQVYICTSREQCTAWIVALQKAMAIKGSGQTQGSNDSSFFEPENECNANIYSEIPNTKAGGQATLSNVQNGHAAHRINAKVEDHYSVPKDLLESESFYSDLSEVAISQNKTPGESAEKPALPPPRADTNNNGSLDCYADGYSMGPAQNDSCYADGVTTGQMKQTNYAKKESQNGPSSSLIKPSRIAPVAPHVKDASPSSLKDAELHSTPQSNTVNNANQTEVVANSMDELLSIFDAMDVEWEVPDLEFVITNDDMKPVTDLKTCLRDNNVHCRVSTSRLSQSQDPIASCKSYLVSLDS